MTTPDQPFTPEKYQSMVQKLQADFQKKMLEAQAGGDFTAISALSAQLQKDIMALSTQLNAAFTASGMAAAQSLLAQDNDEEEEGEEGEEIPKDEETTKLMLLGAMYVEENNMLGHMTRMKTTAELAADPKGIATAFFSSLDMNMSDVDPDEIADVLAESWDVEGKDDLVNRLAWLLKEGHHKELKQLISFCKTNPSPESRTIAAYRARFDDPLAYKDETEEEFRDALTVAEHTEVKLSPAGIRGWDVARYVHVLRLGYMAGLMNADECWVHLRRLKEPVTKTFSGWKDFAHSYMTGFQWWSGTTGPIDDACKRLLEHPQSPWTLFGWIS